MDFIWKFILREYELLKFDFRRQTCWLQIFHKGQKNNEKIEIDIFYVSKGILAENFYIRSYEYIEECRDTRTSALRALPR